MLTPAQEDLLFQYIEEAWDASSNVKKAKYARKALEIDPDALDGYLLLSHATSNSAERQSFLREGVRRGQKIWANEIKRPAQSYFWADMDTRPYMRLVHVLALTLWDDGDQQGALELCRYLLKLNPNDNQGIRHLLLAWYPVTGDWTDFAKLLKKYGDDGSTEHLFAACLSGMVCPLPEATGRCTCAG